MVSDDGDGLIDLLEEIKSIAPSPSVSSTNDNFFDVKESFIQHESHHKPHNIQPPIWKNVQSISIDYFKSNNYPNPVNFNFIYVN